MEQKIKTNFGAAGKVWPPPIDHDGSVSSRKADAKNLKKASKRWYYTTIASFFVLDAAHRFLQHRMASLTLDNVQLWLGTPFLLWLTIQVWIQHFRNQMRHHEQTVTGSDSERRPN